MNPVDFVRARPYVALALIGLALAVAAGLAWPVNVPPPAEQSEADWDAGIGGLIKSPSEASFAVVRDSPAWGGGSDAGARGVQRAVWRLAGIITGPRPAALVAQDDQKPRQVPVGGELPDGGVVEQLMASGIVYVLDGCRRERRLYASDAERNGDACLPPVPPGR